MKHPRCPRVNRRLLICCRIPVQSISAPRTIRGLIDAYFADSASPWRMRCIECGDEWLAKDNLNADWKTTSCSQCYSLNVVITRLALDYLNYAGDSDFIDRYNFGQSKSEKERSLKEESTSV